MSLINKKVSDFTVQAYHNGEFKEAIVADSSDQCQPPAASADAALFSAACVPEAAKAGAAGAAPAVCFCPEACGSRLR